MEPLPSVSPQPDLNALRQRALDAEQPAAEQPAAEPAAAPAAPTGHPEQSAFIPPPPPAPVALSAPTGPTEGPAGVRRMSQATAAYATARAEVDRLNTHLAEGLQNPALASDPAAAARFRDEFRAQNAGAYEREAEAARTLATAVREAGPNSPRPAVTVLSALNTLAGSSEAGQAIALAGSLSAGANPVLPPAPAALIAERAAGTQVRADLAAGASAEDSANLVGTMLRTAGFGSTAARLAAPAELAARFAGLGLASVAGGLSSAGADFNAFLRTGDRTSLVAGGLQLAGAAGAGMTLAGAGAAATVPLAVVGGGALVARELARQNEYQGSVTPAMAAALGTTPEAARAIAAHPDRIAELQQLGLSNAQITALAADPNRRHFITSESARLLGPYLARATPAERAQLLGGLGNDDVGAASRATTFGPGMLERVSSPEARALLERLLPRRR